MIGKNLVRYKILEQPGEGGKVEACKAKCPRLERILVIKKFREQHSESFKREARSIAARSISSIRPLLPAARNDPEFWEGETGL